jgi:hypothetical protein
VVLGDVAYVLQIHAASIFGSDPEDGGRIYLQDVGNISHNHAV